MASSSCVAAAADSAGIARSRSLGMRWNWWARMPSSGAPSLARLRRADAAEPVGGRAQTVAVVVEQGMLRGQLRTGAVILVDPAAGGQKRLEQRDLAVLIEVGLGVGDRLGEILAEPGEVLS